MSDLILRVLPPGLRGNSGRSSQSRVRLTALALACLAVLAACSEERSGAADDLALDKVGSAAAERAFPPGAAAPLSVVMGEQLPGGNSADAALNCAVAMRVTNELVAQQGANVGRENIALMNSAATMFRDRAIAAASGGEARREVVNDLEKRFEAAQSRKAEQVRIAMGCLRSVPGAG